MQLYKNFFKLVKANKISVIIATIIMVVYAAAMIFSAPYIIDKDQDTASEKSADYKNLGVIFRDNDDSELRILPMNISTTSCIFPSRITSSRFRKGSRRRSKQVRTYPSTIHLTARSPARPSAS